MVVQIVRVAMLPGVALDDIPDAKRVLDTTGVSGTTDNTIVKRLCRL
jgi:hypothetical protein